MIIDTYILPSREEISVKSIRETKTIKLTEIPIMDRQSNGSFIVRDRIEETYIPSTLKDKEMVQETIMEIKTNKELSTLEKVDSKIMTIDDLLDNIENK